MLLFLHLCFAVELLEVLHVLFVVENGELDRGVSFPKNEHLLHEDLILLPLLDPLLLNSSHLLSLFFLLPLDLLQLHPLQFGPSPSFSPPQQLLRLVLALFRASSTLWIRVLSSLPEGFLQRKELLLKLLAHRLVDFAEQLLSGFFASRLFVSQLLHKGKPAVFAPTDFLVIGVGCGFRDFFKSGKKHSVVGALGQGMNFVLSLNRRRKWLKGVERAISGIQTFVGRKAGDSNVLVLI